MLRTRLKILKLNRWRRKLEKESRRARAESLAKKDEKIYEDWYAEHQWEFQTIDASLKETISRDLMNEAESLYLPTPDYGDGEKWEQEGPPGSYVLTAAAMAELRAAIRKEKRERREVIEWWVKVAGGAIGILTGLVGALIGLIAVWKK